MGRDQGLIGGDDRLAQSQRGFDGGLGRTIGPTDQFDKDVIVR